MRKSFHRCWTVSAAAVAVAATTLLLAAEAAAIPTARAAAVCQAPGRVPGASIHSLSTRNMSCTTARQDTERYIEKQTVPHGFTCSATHHGAREVSLVCHHGDRSFQAAWRVTSSVAAVPATAASPVAIAAKTCQAPGMPHGFTCELSHPAKHVTSLLCRDANGRWFDAAWRPV